MNLEDLKVTQYELYYVPAVMERITLDMVPGDGIDRWAIRDATGYALSKKPSEGWYYFEREPLPSNRDEDYYAEYRWDSAEEALAFWNEHKDRVPLLA